MRTSRKLASDLRCEIDETPVVVVDTALDDVLERCWLGQHTALSEFLSDLDATLKIHNHQYETEIGECLPS